MDKTTKVLLSIITATLVLISIKLWEPRVAYSGQRLFNSIKKDFQTELKINEMYFIDMSKAASLKEKYNIFYKYRMAYLKNELLSEIDEMKNPILGTPASNFPSIVSYVDDEHKWEWCPFSKSLFDDYKMQILKYIK